MLANKDIDLKRLLFTYIPYKSIQYTRYIIIITWKMVEKKLLEKFYKKIILLYIKITTK
jgi:hypothetical protein